MNSKSAYNRTMDTPISDGNNYISRCISVSSPIGDIGEIINRTVCGDVFEILPNIPKESVDLIIADPPYNLTKNYNGNKFVRLNDAAYEEYTRKWLTMAISILKPNGSIYVCSDWRTSLIVGRVIDDLLKIRNRITWQREKGRGAKANWKNGMEDIWFATKSNEYTFNLADVMIRKKVIAPYRVNGSPKGWTENENGNYRDTCPSNFWNDITVPFWSMSENTPHPTQKSEKMIAKIILASSNPGDIVFDPFLGSGTTSVTAKKLRRSYLGVEIDKQYCLWTEQRLEKADRDKTIQGYADNVFWERNSLSEQMKHRRTNNNSHCVGNAQGESDAPLEHREQNMNNKEDNRDNVD